MRRLGILTALFLMLVFCASASAQTAGELDGNPLSITTDGLGALQIRDATLDGAGMFWDSGDDPARGGLEIVDGTDYYPLRDARRQVVQAPQRSGNQLTSIYDVGPHLQVTEVLTYTDGGREVGVTYNVKNTSGATTSFRAGELADLDAGSDDTGSGFLIDHAGTRMIGGSTVEGALVGIEEDTPWASYETGEYGQVFDDFEAGPLSQRVDPTPVDNGVGVEWSRTLAPGAETVLSLRWRVGADNVVNTPGDSSSGSCTTGADGCTLRDALTDTAAGDLVAIPAGQYSVNSQLNVTRPLTIFGGGARATTITAPDSRVLALDADGTVDLRGVTISGGVAGSGAGGGILVGLNSTLRLSDATVAGNSATAGGGIASEGRLELVRSTVSGNQAASGGGLSLTGGSASLENSTLSGNQGGAIYTGVDLGLANVTVADNDGALRQSFDGDQKTTATNTLLARNGGTACVGTEAPHQVQGSHGLIDTAGAATCQIEGTGNNVADDTLLGDLGNGGGNTDTQEPAGDSRAIDAGDPGACPDIDQRGVLRPQGLRCDVGAVEVLQPTGFLEVDVQVVNDNGGHATASDFLVHVTRDGQEVGTPQHGDESGLFYELPRGGYRVAADPLSGYTLTYGADCAPNGAVSVQPDSDASQCTIVADDAGAAAPATLRVVTSVVNDSGGTRGPADFTIFVRSGGADVAGSPAAGTSAGRSYSLAAGSYTVAAAAPAGYAAAIGGDCAASGTVTLAAGATRTCTITGTDNTVNQELPPPELHESVNVAPSSGTVKVKVPGSRKFVTLHAGDQVPLGTILDTRHGRVTLVAAADASGGTATAQFYDGLFKVGQTKGKKPITQLRLVEKLTCPKSGKKASAAKKKVRKRRLWGDGHGHFRTTGKHSAATVVGTKWMVQDSCTATTTKVARGIVSVRDFAKRKTVTVKAGHRYVARAKH